MSTKSKAAEPIFEKDETVFEVGGMLKPNETARFNSGVLRILRVFASLKLTVVLFALSIFIVLAGTLAQVEKDIWEVVDAYFRMKITVPSNASDMFSLGFAKEIFWSMFAWIDLQIFAPPAFFPEKPVISGGFPFPKGWLIGLVMIVNLVSAHLIRFKVQAKGTRLWVGLGVIVFGLAFTAAVITTGMANEAAESRTDGEWTALWILLLGGLIAVFIGSISLIIYLGPDKNAHRIVAAFAGVISAGLFVWFYREGQFSGASMRILWQLTKATAAAEILLGGCILVFKKRAGIVLLHFGIGLMMLSELLVGVAAVEGQMVITEGQTVNWIQDIRELEVAIVDESNPEQAEVVVIPESVFLRGEPIENDLLPFNITEFNFKQNARLRRLGPNEKSNATKGLGLVWEANRVRAGTGTDVGGNVDMSAAYVTFVGESGQDLGTYLLSAAFSKPQLIEVTVDGKTKEYGLTLRFKRTYKAYSLRLDNVRKDDYLGTNTPRNYSSDIFLTDDAKNVYQPVHIWMNNPLRYAGETFYQSGYYRDPDTGEETTTLQVVTNTGWMIPYVSCMIVWIGLQSHFVNNLLRFIYRELATAVGRGVAKRIAEDNEAAESEPRPKKRRIQQKDINRPALVYESIVPDRQKQMRISIICSVVAVFVLDGWLLSKANLARVEKGAINLYEFGKIPVAYQGRTKPIDTLARNSLRIISDRESFDWTMDAKALRKNRDEIQEAIEKEWPKKSFDKLEDFKGTIDELTTLVEEEVTYENREKIAVILQEYSTIEARALRRNKDEIKEALEEEWPMKSFDKLDEFFDELEEFEGTFDNLTTLAEEVVTADSRERIAFVLHACTTEWRQPAIRWLLDVITRPEHGLHHRVLRIENLELLDRLGLKRRKRFRYSFMEFVNKLSLMSQDAEHARTKNADDRTFYERKVLELEQQIGLLDMVMQSFSEARIRRDHIREDLMMALRRQQALESRHPPLAIPPEQDDEDGKWQTYAVAYTSDLIQMTKDSSRAFELMQQILRAQDAEEFNEKVTAYHRYLKKNGPKELNRTSLSFESYFNNFSPFYYAAWVYLAAFVIAAVSWLRGGWFRHLNWACFWVCMFTLVVHTFAIGARIYISGRPPVTNLYSSAVYIGWGAVVLGMVLEFVYRIGVGNIIASICGAATLAIAHFLAGDGDTFTVLQAVLDTQFWLSTHVVCITTGYTTTYVAGILGVVYILAGFGGPGFKPIAGRDLTRMMYGVLCFSMFFSFVGTVLGGLWADDSWGRFWGWDPKENGALIIVLWNALVLHARWGGLVRDRGLAMLVIAGNITVTWSWFMVNELGVGLHSYGFTDGVLFASMLFIASQLGIISLGGLQMVLAARQRSKIT